MLLQKRAAGRYNKCKPIIYDSIIIRTPRHEGTDCTCRLGIAPSYMDYSPAPRCLCSSYTERYALAEKHGMDGLDDQYTFTTATSTISPESAGEAHTPTLQSASVPTSGRDNG